MAGADLEGRAQFGKRLREARQADRRSQDWVGEQVGMSGAAVSLWESGKSAPNREIATRLERLFNTADGYFATPLGFRTREIQPDDVARLERLEQSNAELRALVEEQAKVLARLVKRRS